MLAADLRLVQRRRQPQPAQRTFDGPVSNGQPVGTRQRIGLGDARLAAVGAEEGHLACVATAVAGALAAACEAFGIGVGEQLGDGLGRIATARQRSGALRQQTLELPYRLLHPSQLRGIAAPCTQTCDALGSVAAAIGLALLQRGSEPRGQLALPARLPLQQQVREAWRGRQARQLPAVGGDAALRIQRAHRQQQLAGIVPVGGRRRIEQAQGGRIGDAPAGQLQREAAEVGAQQFRRVVRDQPPMLLLRPEPVGRARP